MRNLSFKKNTEPMSDNKSPVFHFNPSLDGVRGMAVLSVMLLHASYGYFKGGFIGVDLFFVLSGYLITSILLVEHSCTKKISYAKFYTRRALRLLPALFLGLALINLSWDLLGFPTKYQCLASISGLLYFTNLLAPDKSGLCIHLWSLAVEEHFYFLWPLAMSAFFVKVPFKTRLWSLGIAILSVILFRALVYHTHPTRDYDSLFAINAYFFTFCRIDSILMGCVLAIVLAHKSMLSRQLQKWMCRAVLVFFVAAGFLLNDLKPYMFYGGFLLVDLLCVLIVFSAVTKSEPIFNNPILGWIGRRSYGIYIYHLPIFSLLEVLRVNHSILNYIIVTILRFGITLIVAEISFRFIESPILKQKKKYEVVHG